MSSMEMLPYPPSSNSKPASSSWDHYYSLSSSDQRHATITSGIAAALTLGVFFAVFLLTFGCRLLHSSRRRRTNDDDDAVVPNYSLDDQRMFICCSSIPPPPLPNYEDALKMPHLMGKDGPDCPLPPSINAPFNLPPNRKSATTASSSPLSTSPPPFPHPPSSPSPPPPFSATAAAAEDVERIS